MICVPGNPWIPIFKWIGQKRYPPYWSYMPKIIVFFSRNFSPINGQLSERRLASCTERVCLYPPMSANPKSKTSQSLWLIDSITAHRSQHPNSLPGYNFSVDKNLKKKWPFIRYKFVNGIKFSARKFWEFFFLIFVISRKAHKNKIHSPRNCWFCVYISFDNLLQWQCFYLYPKSNV